MKLLENFVQQLQAKGYAYNTIKSYQSALTRFFKQLTIPIEQVKEAEIASYLTKRNQK